MKKDYIKIADGYLYSPWNGTIKEYKGVVQHKEETIVNWHIIPGDTYFLIFDETGKIIKKYKCSPIEGEMYNKIVWLSESDLNRATELFIEYEETQIAQLEFKIDSHKKLIESYKKD